MYEDVRVNVLFQVQARLQWSSVLDHLCDRCGQLGKVARPPENSLAAVAKGRSGEVTTICARLGRAPARLSWWILPSAAPGTVN